MPKLGMPEIRRPQLIHATMETIDRVGLQGASVVAISRCAGVSPAIINHYFGGKHGLIEATMRHVLRQLADGIRARLSACPPDDAHARIRAIVAGNFDPSQLERPVVKTWLAFWAMAMHDPMLFRLQRVNERRLLSYLRRELKRLMPHSEAHETAQTLAALIDGIWLRGALATEPPDADRARQLIDHYLAHCLPAARLPESSEHTEPTEQAESA